MGYIAMIVLQFCFLLSVIGAFADYKDVYPDEYERFQNRGEETPFEIADKYVILPESMESMEFENDKPNRNNIMADYAEPSEEQSDFISLNEDNNIDSKELAEEVSEMEEADDRSRVHVFTLENGVIREEDVPDFTDTDDLEFDDQDNDGDDVNEDDIFDDVSEDDVFDDVYENDELNDNDDNGIEAFLSEEVRLVKLNTPRRRMIVDKRMNRNKPAVVQILVVVDYSLYKKFLFRHKMNKLNTLAGIKKYYTAMVALANERYATIHVPGMTIRLVLSNIIVSKDSSDSPWVERIVQYKKRKAVVNAVTGLERFQKWLMENKDLPPYDFAISFTSYDMLLRGTNPASGKEDQSLCCSFKFDNEKQLIFADASCVYSSIEQLKYGAFGIFGAIKIMPDVNHCDPNKYCAGVAQVEGMCSKEFGQSSSLIVDRADYRSGHVIAHEIGHSLGATHDGVKQNVRCPYAKNHVMSPKANYAKTTFRNIYTFSTCSLTQMRKFLRSPDASCLYDDATPLMSYDVKNNPPGALFSADEQCKMVFGKASGLCSEPSLQEPMCHRLWCKTPEDNTRCRTHDLLYALPGTTCDVNKRCEKMTCVSSQQAHKTTPPKSKWTHNLTVPRVKQKNRKQHTVGQPQTNQQPTFRNSSGRCRDRKVRQCNAIIRPKPTLCRRHRVRKSCCQSCSRYYKRF